jgi:hypothetical protein
MIILIHVDEMNKHLDYTATLNATFTLAIVFNDLEKKSENYQNLKLPSVIELKYII